LALILKALQRVLRYPGPRKAAVAKRLAVAKDRQLVARGRQPVGPMVAMAREGWGPLADQVALEAAVGAQGETAEPVAVVEPVVAEPVAAEPVAEEPVVVEPVAEEPVATVELVVAEPVVEELVAEEPVATVELVVAEPVLEELVAEELVVEELVAEELVATVELVVEADQAGKKSCDQCRISFVYELENQNEGGIGCMKKFNVVVALVVAIFIGSAAMAYAGPRAGVGTGLGGFGPTGVQGPHTYGPGDGTGYGGVGPKDGTGYGPGSNTGQMGFGSSVNPRGYTYGPGDGTGNDVPPADGTGYGPGPR